MDVCRVVRCLCGCAMLMDVSVDVSCCKVSVLMCHVDGCQCGCVML